MKDLIKIYEGKITKHEEKLKLHKQAEKVLRADYEDLRDRNEDERANSVGKKLLSTIKNIEFHVAKYKTYKKVVEQMKDRI